MPLADLGTSEQSPIIVQKAVGIPTADEDWQTVRYAKANSARFGLSADLGSAEITMSWGDINDPNDPHNNSQFPLPPLAVDDVIRICETTVDEETGAVVVDNVLCYDVVERVLWEDATNANVKAIGLGILLSRLYLTDGQELDGNGSPPVLNPGYLPAFNAIPGGDCSADAYQDPTTGEFTFVHDRRASGDQEEWTAHDIADFLLKVFMRGQIPGVPGGLNHIPWKLHADSAGDYIPDTLDLHGKTIAEALELLFGIRRNLCWTVVVEDGYAQVLVIDLSDAGTDLDTDGDLQYSDPQIEERRDGYDYVKVSGENPIIGITLHWDPDGSDNAIEPDGWEPGATADGALDAALVADQSGSAYHRPEWRRFRIVRTWNGSQYNDGGAGLRNLLTNGSDPPDGPRFYTATVPPPSTLTVERYVPCGDNFSDDQLLPNQSPVVLAGDGTAWVELSECCRPSPAGGGVTDKTEQGTAIINLGDSAEAADQLRTVLKDGGTLLVTIGIREWAPLQAAWTAPQADWSKVSPRIYHLRRAGIEEHRVLANTVTGVDLDGNLTLTGTDIVRRDDTTKLQTIRDQLALRYGRTITSATIKRSGIHIDMLPGHITSNLVLNDARSYELNIPLAEVTLDFGSMTTELRWTNLLKDKPVA